MSSHPTRESLLDAGVRLAGRMSLLEMTVADIVREAGVAKGTFYVHFADRAAFLVAQHRRFYDQLGMKIDAAVHGLAPGPQRLQRAAMAYLDGCVDAKAVRAILLEARTIPEVANEVAQRVASSASRATQDFKAMGIKNPEACAQLFIAMVSETALAEFATGKPATDLRAALWRLAGIAQPRKSSR